MIEYRIVRSCQLTNNPAQIALFLQCILHQVMFPRSSRNFLQKTCEEHAMPMNREMWLISYFRVWEKSIQISLNFLGGNHRVLWRPISVYKIKRLKWRKWDIFCHFPAVWGTFAIFLLSPHDCSTHNEAVKRSKKSFKGPMCHDEHQNNCFAC